MFWKSALISVFDACTIASMSGLLGVGQLELGLDVLVGESLRALDLVVNLVKPV